MSESIVLHPQRATRRARSDRHRHGALLRVLVGGLALAVIWSAFELARSVRIGPTAEVAAVAPGPVASVATPELPKEWRTWKKGVDFESMYAKPSVRRLDWIRGNGY